MNVWTYRSDQFYTAASAPMCRGDQMDDTVPLRAGAFRWNQTRGFTDIDNLVSVLRGLVGLSETGEGSQRAPIDVLAIQCHGRPGQLALLPGTNTFHAAHFSTYLDRFVAINQMLQGGRRQGRSRWPLAIFMSCSAADTPRGTELFQWISATMENTRVVGFRTILTTDGTSPQELPGGGICLPPDIRVTEQRYDEDRDIADQPASWEQGDVAGFPTAAPRSFHAREFRNGALFWESTESTRTDRRSGLFRRTRTFAGRGTGGPPRVQRA